MGVPSLDRVSNWGESNACGGPPFSESKNCTGPVGTTEDKMGLPGAPTTVTVRLVWELAATDLAAALRVTEGVPGLTLVVSGALVVAL
jgi:hypothetical protein